eukprot:TRINITY_DN11239_c0_g1::TRINITY_DN11239_c0_g1_i1::g.758::m.758 TRINITY_DN11239_c0_g1::TRINITY_DN11239_c0_g1_i1::g.758  ORF type:complete len:480 (-),score=69.22,sp/Q6B9X6/VWKA_DICDI/34.36/4e-19,VWA_2/PF13519.1/1.1e-17,VWA/PF00092.23/8.6e-10,Med25_VWA/PF11265.3/8.2e-05 TRINITY_DN11239_c0_g1_i1:342-1637(-)
MAIIQDSTNSNNDDKAPMAPLMLDLVFIVDCTGSMSEYIEAAQTNVTSIVTQLVSSQKCDVQFALVCYRDHPPQDATFVTKVFPFTSSLQDMKKNVDWMQASGGGDGPEAVADGMYEASKLPYRPNATKFCILIADAPPHGLGESGDGFPNGCPDGHDPIQIARDLTRKGVTVYTVGCEPALASYRHARTFLRSVADITGGQAVNLASASLLADLILGGATEEIALEKLMDDVHREAEAEGLKSAGLYTVEVEKRIALGVTKKLQDRGIRSKQMKTDGRIESEFAPCMVSSSTLAEAREKLSKIDPREAAQREGLSESFAEAHYGGCRSAPKPKSLDAKKKRKSSLLSFLPSFKSLTFGVSHAKERKETENGSDDDDVGSHESVPHSGSGPSSAPPAAVTPSTYVEVSEDVVSYEQVERMVRKTAARSGLY